MTFNKENSEVLPLYTKNGINGNGPQISLKSSNVSINVPSNSTSPKIKVFCFDLSQRSSQTQFLFCCAGVFALYLIYGYLQELIFTLDGFKPYGWFLTLIQFGYYTIFGYLERQLTEPHGQKRAIPIKTYNLLAFLTLGTMGLSNSSLGYLNYPTQVIFKCCKLVPVLIGSILIQKKRHGPLDFLAAIAMCVGLTAFTLGSFQQRQIKFQYILLSIKYFSFSVDAQVSPNFDTYGVAMISTALLFDAIIGNVQEKAMREHKASNVEVVQYSYGIGFVYLLVVLTLTGNLMSGLRFCATVSHPSLSLLIALRLSKKTEYNILFSPSQYPIQTYGYAFLFSLSGYLGIQFVLTLVRTCGAPLAATVTTARKAVTIIISFIFFAKPFSIQ